jgi:Predicted ATPase (AAA+ superfamily)
MKRLFENELLKWKQNGMTKPLMVIGVRQIGKTHTITEFCKEKFEEFIYIDLEKNDNIRKIFEETIDPDEILPELELRLEKSINLDKTVFFFDEVQVSERFIVSLKYFNQSEKPFKIVCAGSLLGVKLNRFKSSFPVGKVEILRMYPLNFEEYLMACGQNMLLEKIKSCYTKLKSMPDDLHKRSLDLYRKYLCVGGMPEAVLNFISNDMNIMEFDKNISEILTDMYLADMSKYTMSKFESVKIEKVYKNISIQLGKENTKRFIYNGIESGASKRKYESSIDWLVSSGMAINCNLVETIMKPLKAYENTNMFKLYLSDVGMLTSITRLNFSDIILDNDFMYKGAIAENYVACEFLNKSISLNYWHSGNTAEIDFLLYNDDGIIPIEVKASENTKSQSLKTYVERYKPKYSIRISAKNFGFENNIKSVPLYATFCI